MKGNPKISLVMPVFNGEKYLSESLESLLKQSFKDFEIICINDASTDSSLDILKDYAKRTNLRIINLDNNIGRVPFIIKTYGIPNIRGNYYMYMSQDDFLSLDCLEKLYLTVCNNDADAVIPDFVYYSTKDSEKKLIGINGNRGIILKGKEAFVLSLDWKITGAALWRSEIVKRIGYEDFNMYADEYTVRRYFLECKKVAFCDGVFYYRIDNPEAITRKMKPALFSKVYKESKLLELVYLNSEQKVFKVRLENLINMFYDYHQILFEQKFSILEVSEALKLLKMAYQHFNKFINIIPFSVKGYTKIFVIKFYILRSYYFVFYTFCKLKFMLNLISNYKY